MTPCNQNTITKIRKKSSGVIIPPQLKAAKSIQKLSKTPTREGKKNP